MAHNENQNRPTTMREGKDSNNSEAGKFSWTGPCARASHQWAWVYGVSNSKLEKNDVAVKGAFI